jgi:hypothetical protein
MRYIGKTLFELTTKSVDEKLRSGTWWTYADAYGLYTTAEGARYVHAPHAEYPFPHVIDRDEAWEYRPLVTYPSLFLEFARLADGGGLDVELDTKKNEDVALRWAETYGILGLTPVKYPGAWWADPRGGMGDTVWKFAEEAWIAHETLELYQAAVAPDGPDVDTILEFLPDPHYEEVFPRNPRAARERALDEVVTVVESQLVNSCYPVVHGQGVKRSQGWGFKNLLGAMWLQMMWQVTSRNVRQCRRPGCLNLISFTPPGPLEIPATKQSRVEPYKRGPYNTRRDKLFCSSRCRKAHAYQEKAKKGKRQK